MNPSWHPYRDPTQRMSHLFWLKSSLIKLQWQCKTKALFWSGEEISRPWWAHQIFSPRRAAMRDIDAETACQTTAKLVLVKRWSVYLNQLGRYVISRKSYLFQWYINYVGWIVRTLGQMYQLNLGEIKLNQIFAKSIFFTVSCRGNISFIKQIHLPTLDDAKA